MNKSIFSIILLTVGIPFLAVSQTATEAFRLSLSDPMGTARNLGAGNSMIAIGPDFSAIGLNPAGLGGYGKSEMLITGSLSINDHSAAFGSDPFNTTDNNFSHFNISNLGLIIHARPRYGNWVASNWAIGFNRVADYNRELDYSGSTLGSITDAWRENAFGVAPDDLNGFEEGLAYTSGAIYDFESDLIYETDYSLNPQYALMKEESSLLTGGKSELFLAYGADYDHKLFFGFSVGLPIVNFTQARRYTEADGNDDGIPFFNDLEYTNSLTTEGYGWNAKAGVIIKPSPFLNLAFAIHSPTRLSLTDRYNTTLAYDFTDENNDGPISSESPFGSFEYALRTPWSASGGIGIIAGKSGFLAAHARYTDYGSMKYIFDVRGNGNQFNSIEREINQDIKTNYGSAVQLNMGGELIIKDFYRLRGGVSLLQSAFNNDSSFDPSYHAGLGYRGDHFYFDLGYKLTSGEEGYLPYETSNAVQPLVLIEKSEHQIAFTAGVKF